MCSEILWNIQVDFEYSRRLKQMLENPEVSGESGKNCEILGDAGTSWEIHLMILEFLIQFLSREFRGTFNRSNLTKRCNYPNGTILERDSFPKGWLKQIYLSEAPCEKVHNLLCFIFSGSVVSSTRGGWATSKKKPTACISSRRELQPRVHNKVGIDRFYQIYSTISSITSVHPCRIWCMYVWHTSLFIMFMVLGTSHYKPIKGGKRTNGGE